MIQGIKNFFRRFLLKVSLAIFGCIFSLCCTFVYYYFILQHLHVSLPTIFFLLTGSCVFSIGFALSKQIRCMAFLSLPEFGSGSGKRTVQAVIILLTISGPIQNAGMNGREIIRMMNCLSDLAVNITLTSKEVVLAPIKSTLENMMGDHDKIPRLSITSLENVMKPLENEIEGGVRSEYTFKENSMPRVELVSDLDERTIANGYKSKLTFHCKTMLSQATTKCKTSFENLYDKCYATVTAVLGWVLCGPLKMDHICSMWSDSAFDGSCDVADSIVNNVGSTFVSAKQGLEKMKNMFSSPDLQIGIGTIFNWVENGLEQVLENKEVLWSYFKNVDSNWKIMFRILKVALGLFHLLVFFKTMKYHKKYSERISFDNCYITKYFQEIDKRRLEEGRANLLPLKRFEASTYFKVTSLNWTKEEKIQFFPRLTATLVQLIVVVILFVYDYLFTQLLVVLRKHTQFEVSFKGDHIFQFLITGAGPLAEFLRSFIKQIDLQHHAVLLQSTTDCLPIPSRLENSFYFQLGLLLAILFGITFLEIYCRRMRHCVANLFYKKRSKRRILWLYNEALRRRKRGIKEMKLKILENVDYRRAAVDINIFHSIARKCFGYKSKKKCICCLFNEEAFECHVCGYSYCQNCFNDMGKTCLHCLARLEMFNILNDNDNDNYLV